MMPILRKIILISISIILLSELASAQTYFPAGIDNTNLAIWLDANSGVTVNAGNVTQWTDLSGNGRNATQATTANSPILINNVLNGQSVIRFDGINDFLGTGAIPALNNNILHTTFAVFQSKKPATPSAAFYSSYGANVPTWGLYTAQNPSLLTANSVFFEAIDGSGNPVFRQSQSFIDTDPLPRPYVVATGIWNGNSTTTTTLIDFYRNDQQGNFSGGTVTAPSASPGTHSNTTIGAYPDSTNFLEGDIAEIIIYNAVLNNVQRNLIQSYLFAKYNIASGGLAYYTPPAPTQYIQGISGIGRDAVSQQLTASSAGLNISSGIVSGDFLANPITYLMYGYQSATNPITTQNLPSTQVLNRWQRDWYINFNGNNVGRLNLSFDFGDGGVAGTPNGTYALLYRANQTGAYRIVSLSKTIQNTDQVVFEIAANTAGNGYYTLGTFQKLPGAGNALAFDGTNDQVEIPNSSLTNFGTGNFTIEAWVKTNATNRTIFETANAGLTRRKELIIDGSGTLVGKVTGSNGTATMTGSVINDNEWHHVALVYSSGSSSLYVDGANTSTSNVDAGNTDTGTPLFLGRNAAGGSFFLGQIDELRIWNTARTESNIRSKMCSKLDFDNADLVAYFQLDESGGSSMALDIARSQTATLQGFAFTASSGWLTSGARLGDYSTFVYGARTLSFANPSGSGETDNLNISVPVSGNPTAPIGIHLYYVEGAPNVTTLPAGLNSYDDSRYWGILILGPATYTYSATYNYATNSNVNLDTGIEFIYRADNAATSWIRASGGVTNTLTTSIKRLVINGLTGTEILLASPITRALPISLLTFEVSKNNEESIALDWQTISETNNAYFEIQRSADSQDFETLAQVEGQGNSQALTDYQWIDYQPLSGFNYYRLKQIDQDGQFSFSPIRGIRFLPLWQVSLYPNPSQEKINISFSQNLNRSIPLVILNQQGQKVRELNISKDVRSHQFIVKDLPAGIYYLQGLDIEHPFTFKFIKY